MIQFDQVWTSLNMFVHVCASLNQFSTFWSNFIKFNQVWSSLNNMFQNSSEIKQIFQNGRWQQKAIPKTALCCLTCGQQLILSDLQRFTQIVLQFKTCKTYDLNFRADDKICWSEKNQPVQLHSCHITKVLSNYVQLHEKIQHLQRYKPGHQSCERRVSKL